MAMFNPLFATASNTEPPVRSETVPVTPVPVESGEDLGQKDETVQEQLKFRPFIISNTVTTKPLRATITRVDEETEPEVNIEKLS